jgi:calcium binding protein
MPMTGKSGHERSGGGWYDYLQDQLRFPFKAVCTVRRASSPLRVSDEAEVIDMAGGEECEHEIFVTIRRGEGDLAVPLSQLKPVQADEQTTQAVEDWHYWVNRDYEF